MRKCKMRCGRVMSAKTFMALVSGVIYEWEEVYM